MISCRYLSVFEYWFKCYQVCSGASQSQHFYIPFRSVQPDPLSVFYQLRGVFHAYDCWKTVFPRNDGTMGHKPAAYFRHQAFDGYKQRRPAGISK